MICWLRSAGVRGSSMTLLAREIAVALVEQHLDLALPVASRAYVLDRGTVAFAESAEEFVPIQNYCSIWRLEVCFFDAGYD